MAQSNPWGNLKAGLELAALRAGQAVAKLGAQMRESVDRDTVSMTAAESAMDAAYNAMMAPRPPVDVANVLDLFLMEWLGTRGPDLDGVYGPQSTDLVAAYVREFKPEWNWTLGHAGELADKPWALSPAFQAVPAGQRGDIVVFRASPVMPFGNVGIVTDVTPLRYFAQVTGVGCRVVTGVGGPAPAAFFRKV